MIYFFDSYYHEDRVLTACIGIDDWRSTAIQFQQADWSEVPAAYESGQFYKRELPGLLKLIAQLPLRAGDILVIDGYVYLDDNFTKGLGGYLFEQLGSKYPVIGVAKKHYLKLSTQYSKILRGQSTKPLFITAFGYDLDRAAEHVQTMAGAYRIPDILKQVDQLSREA